ncbi:MAG TPA: NADH-quinone oxidoreductase subunit J [Opitutus sp.]|nr:NADH-quinone oxidoreductase subunit J [Opitutus sp.]
MITVALIAAVMLASAACALSRRNLIHAALLLIFTWAGVASFYLWAGAEFVAFAQLLIYAGAVSMVVLFAVLLTRQSLDDPLDAPTPNRRSAGAIATGGAVFAVLAYAIFDESFPAPVTPSHTLTVRQIGTQLMGPHAAALLIAGVILTVALLGATVIAAQDKPEDSP